MTNILLEQIKCYYKDCNELLIIDVKNLKSFYRCTKCNKLLDIKKISIIQKQSKIHSLKVKI